MNLFCLFLGKDVDTFPVSVGADDTIADLKTAILQEADAGVDMREAHKIQLLKMDRGWLACDSDDATQLAKGTAKISLTKLSPRQAVRQVFTGDLGENVIHVLVKLPGVEKEIERRRAEEEREARKEDRLTRVPEKRKGMWKVLNAAVASKRHKNGYSTPFSAFDWDDIPISYTPQLVTSGLFHELLQYAPDISDDVLDEMTRIVEMKKQAYERACPSKATRAQFMSTIFEFVAYMFKADPERVELSVQTKLAGECVRANGVVDFMITRGHRKICVIEAKEEQFGKDDAQVILGMEVAVEMSEREVMYGIVTDYTVWHFLKRSDEGVERKEDTINPNLNIRDELNRIARKIHAMLT